MVVLMRIWWGELVPQAEAIIIERQKIPWIKKNDFGI
jgi:hypothetical protein